MLWHAGRLPPYLHSSGSLIADSLRHGVVHGCMLHSEPRHGPGPAQFNEHWDGAGIISNVQSI